MIEPLRIGDVADRLPPHNPEAEEAVLGSVLLDQEVIGRGAAILEAWDFYRERDGLVYGAMREFHEAGRPVDDLTLTNELERLGTLDRVGGVAFLIVDDDSLRYVGPEPLAPDDAPRGGMAKHRNMLVELCSYGAGGRCTAFDWYRLLAPGDKIACSDHRWQLDVTPVETRQTLEVS